MFEQPDMAKERRMINFKPSVLSIALAVAGVSVSFVPKLAFSAEDIKANSSLENQNKAEEAEENH